MDTADCFFKPPVVVPKLSLKAEKALWHTLQDDMDLMEYISEIVISFERSGYDALIHDKLKRVAKARGSLWVADRLFNLPLTLMVAYTGMTGDFEEKRFD